MDYENWKKLFTPTTNELQSDYQFTYKFGEYTIGVLLGDVFLNDNLINDFPYIENNISILKGEYDIFKGRKYIVTHGKESFTFYVNAEPTHVSNERKSFLRRAFNFAMKR